MEELGDPKKAERTSSAPSAGWVTQSWNDAAANAIAETTLFIETCGATWLPY
jgi:hypothetical protein